MGRSGRLLNDSKIDRVGGDKESLRVEKGWKECVRADSEVSME